eukprot:scaffold63176_cov32-Tisochrysis_lutea.AAC.3
MWNEEGKIKNSSPPENEKRRPQTLEMRDEGWQVASRRPTLQNAGAPILLYLNGGGRGGGKKTEPQMLRPSNVGKAFRFPLILAMALIVIVYPRD